MPDIPPGYRPAGKLTVTLAFSAGPFSVEGPVLEHDCGSLVSPAGIEQHERLAHPEAGEEAR